MTTRTDDRLLDEHLAEMSDAEFEHVYEITKVEAVRRFKPYAVPRREFGEALSWR